MAQDATLHILEGPLSGQSFPIAFPEMPIGREESGLPLSGYAQISRSHARFYRDGSTLCVQDLGSTNGTHVNGARVATARLHDGAIVKMGDLTMRVSMPNAFPNMTQIAPSQNSISPPTQIVPQSFPPQNFPQYFPPQSFPPQNYSPQNYSPAPQYSANAPREIKNPGLAAVLSFFFCGLGQIYNGEIGKGLVFLCAYSFAWIMTCAFIGFLFLPVLWIWGMVDAYQTAEQINRRGIN